MIFATLLQNCILHVAFSCIACVRFQLHSISTAADNCFRDIASLITISSGTCSYKLVHM